MTPIMSPVQTLRAAKKLVEKGWTGGIFARDKDNVCVPIQDPAACKFCPVGAIYEAAGLDAAAAHDPHRWDIVNKCRQIFRRANGLKESITYWNGHVDRTHQQVLEAFDHAIGYALEN